MQSKNLLHKLRNLWTNEKALVTLAILFISLVFSPYAILGEDTHLFLIDNLEVNLTWVKMVVDAGVYLPPNAVIEQVMNGVPLAGVYGVYDVNLLLFSILGNYAGYAVSKYLMAIIAFSGMYLLLKHFVIRQSPLYISIMVSVLFALLPFWSFSASIAGVPIALFAFLRLRSGNKSVSNWLILIGYAFYSSLILTGVFFLIFVSLLFVWDIIKLRKVNWLLLSGLVSITIAYIISHLPLFVNQLDPNFTSVRAEFTRIQGLTVSQVFMSSLTVFFDGDDYLYNSRHFLSLQRYFIVPTVVITLLLMIRQKRVNKVFLGIVIFIFVTSILYAAYETFHLLAIRNFFMNILPINIGRICWLHPICWYVLFAMSCVFIVNHFQKGKYFVVVVLFAQLFYILPTQEPFYYRNDNTNYAKFFAEEQLSDIKAYLGEDQKNYRIISVGMHPAVSQHNGFYTLDGYMVNYSLEYKHQFRKIIAGELDRSKFWTQDFDEWGGRCYARSSEIDDSTNLTATELPEIKLLDFDYDQLKLMGGKYIFSTAKINTDINNQLQLLKKFEAKNYKKSNWNIFVYRVL